MEGGNIMLKGLPIGYDDFKEIKQKNLYYVDKTDFIRELQVSGGKTTLFLRPRRFGKTLLLSALKYFYEDTGSEERNAEHRALFDGLKIMDAPAEYRSRMTSHPVINLTLQSTKQPDFGMAYDMIVYALAEEYSNHQSILPKLNPTDQDSYQRIMAKKASKSEYCLALLFLSKCLKSAYGKNAVILIDEYDVPLENAYFKGFYEEMIGFIRSFFESALKTNPYLEFAVITGCLRISKESIFTGLNNLKIVSVLNEQFGEYYGFTQAEVDDMLEYYELSSRREDLRLWFDGYNFGQANVYNPWSMINSLDALITNASFLLRPQWANTSSNEIVKSLVEGADRGARADIEKLTDGGAVEKPIHEEVTYSEITKSGDNLWNFLFFTGYLTLKGLRQQGVHLLAELCIPNMEVLYIYDTIIRDWFNGRMQGRDLSLLHKAILNGDTKKAVSAIQEILQESISFYDYAENYYHALLVGLLAKMPQHLVRSNRESGTGRLDIVLEPYNHQDTVIIIELKVTKEALKIKSKAKEALAQISSRHYEAEWRDEGYKKFLFYGIAFYKKNVYIVTENEYPIGKLPTTKKDSMYSEINCTLTEVDILNYVKENPTASCAEIARAIDKSIRTTQAALRSLKGKGLLTREGIRSGRWIL
jgi:DNA-binding CsgD family transcriptional regulator